MSPTEWKVPKSAQPSADDYDFDLDRVLGAVVGLTTKVPGDAFTADTLGTDRAGNGVLVHENGLVLTIGYLVTEAETVWLTLNDGRVVPADVVGFDGETGFGLVQALGRLNLHPLALGTSALAKIGDRVIVAGAGGRQRSVAAKIVAKQEFAGYWEYLLEEAIFTAPGHPHWGGTALIGPKGELLGIGSLQLQQERGKERSESVNMIVPIDLLKPILADMLAMGQANRPARPWLGLYATEIDGQVAIAGLVDDGPADGAGLQMGDLVLSVGDAEVSDLAGMFRAIWALGKAGVEVPLRIQRSDRAMDVRVRSVDRRRLLKRRVMH